MFYLCCAMKIVTTLVDCITLSTRPLILYRLLSEIHITETENSELFGIQTRVTWCKDEHMILSRQH